MSKNRVSGPLIFIIPALWSSKNVQKFFFSPNPLFGPLSKIISALICSKRPVKKIQEMTTFWENFGIWAELFFGTNFWALFGALPVGVVNSKGSQNANFENILKYLNILSKSFILSKYIEPAFPSEAVGAKAPSVLPAPRVSSSLYLFYGPKSSILWVFTYFFWSLLVL